MKLGKPKSDICSHSTLFNMEELAQLVEHLMLLCQMFHISIVGDRRSYFGIVDSVVIGSSPILLPKCSIVYIRLSSILMGKVYISLVAFLTAFFNMGM